jgi:hypothetical protein
MAKRSGEMVEVVRTVVFKDGGDDLGEGAARQC